MVKGEAKEWAVEKVVGEITHNLIPQLLQSNDPDFKEKLKALHEIRDRLELNK